jgi:hypothetical protein
MSYVDPVKQFRRMETQALSQMEAQVDVPAISFSWKSSPLDTSHADFAVMGGEVNGRYYK